MVVVVVTVVDDWVWYQIYSCSGYVCSSSSSTVGGDGRDGCVPRWW